MASSESSPTTRVFVDFQVRRLLSVPSYHYQDARTWFQIKVKTKTKTYDDKSDTSR